MTATEPRQQTNGENPTSTSDFDRIRAEVLGLPADEQRQLIFDMLNEPASSEIAEAAALYAVEEADEEDEEIQELVAKGLISLASPMGKQNLIDWLERTPRQSFDITDEELEQLREEYLLEKYAPEMLPAARKEWETNARRRQRNGLKRTNNASEEATESAA